MVKRKTILSFMPHFLNIISFQQLESLNAKLGKIVRKQFQTLHDQPTPHPQSSRCVDREFLTGVFFGMTEYFIHIRVCFSDMFSFKKFEKDHITKTGIDS